MATANRRIFCLLTSLSKQIVLLRSNAETLFCSIASQANMGANQAAEAFRTHLQPWADKGVKSKQLSLSIRYMWPHVCSESIVSGYSIRHRMAAVFHERVQRLFDQLHQYPLVSMLPCVSCRVLAAVC